VNALNKVAEKVIKPRTNPSLEPAIMKSSCDFTFLWEYHDKKTNIPRYNKPTMSSHFCIYNEFYIKINQLSDEKSPLSPLNLPPIKVKKTNIMVARILVHNANGIFKKVGLTLSFTKTSGEKLTITTSRDNRTRTL
jgi:hypothetical protein